jgi:hypothetical protein
MRKNGVKQIIYSPATMAQKTEQKRKHDRRARSERRANLVREKAERERELVQSRELADGHNIHPRGRYRWQFSKRELNGATSKLIWPVKVS